MREDIVDDFEMKPKIEEKFPWFQKVHIGLVGGVMIGLLLKIFDSSNYIPYYLIATIVVFLFLFVPIKVLHEYKRNLISKKILYIRLASFFLVTLLGITKFVNSYNITEYVAVLAMIGLITYMIYPLFLTKTNLGFRIKATLSTFFNVILLLAILYRIESWPYAQEFAIMGFSTSVILSMLFLFDLKKGQDRIKYYFAINFIINGVFAILLSLMFFDLEYMGF